MCKGITHDVVEPRVPDRRKESRSSQFRTKSSFTTLSTTLLKGPTSRPMFVPPWNNPSLMTLLDVKTYKTTRLYFRGRQSNAPLDHGYVARAQ